MTEDLRAVLSSLAQQAVERLPEGDAHRQLTALHGRLAEPIRVAVAGRASVGKSTLVNALLAQPVVPVGVGECTRVVTWLHYGDVDGARIELADGGSRRLRFGPRRSLPPSLDGVDFADVERLDVTLYNGALRSQTIIDTPGLWSLTAGVSDKTSRLLALRSSAAAAEADAVVYVVAGPPADDDRDVLEELSRHVALPASGANTIVVVTKADRVLDRGGPDKLEALLGDWRERLGPHVRGILPVNGLLAQTVAAGGLDEARAATLGALGAVDRATRERWLRTPRRFVTDGAVPGSAAERRELVEALGVLGVRQGAEAAEAGLSGAASLGRRLLELSGIHGVRALVDAAFTTRAGLLKADVALRSVRALTESPEVPGAEAMVIRDALITHADRLAAAPEAQRLRELELLQRIAASAVVLPDALRLDAERLVTAATSRQRLGLPPEATPEEVLAAAGAAATRWRRFQHDGHPGPEERRAAHVVGLALAGIAGELHRQGETAS
jgi:hypothetical protein